MESLLALGIGLVTIGIAGKRLLTVKVANNTNKAISPAMMRLYHRGGFNSAMNKAEACLILGVRSTDNFEKIKDSHRKMMMLNHPDSGGSTYIASKINEAKEFLLKK
jgi:DnaJ family protein C protein 19